LKVRDPGPTLAIAGLTPIDFTGERNEGFASLEKELKRKGLRERWDMTQAPRPGASLSYQIERKEEKQMDKKRALISFDYDHDLDLKNLLVGKLRMKIHHFPLLICRSKRQYLGSGRTKQEQGLKVAMS
jgi:hypothetical protein